MKVISKTSGILLTIDVALVMLHLLFGQKFVVFNLDGERTIPAYFSGAQLVTIAAVSACVIFLARTRFEKILLSMHALFFLLLGFDEISELHENITYYLVTYVKPWLVFRTLTYMWLVFFSPVILGAFAFFVLFFRKILRCAARSRTLYLGGVLCFAGAIALELASGLIRAKAFFPIEIPLEEGLEIVGATLILTALITEGSERFRTMYRRQEDT